MRNTATPHYSAVRISMTLDSQLQNTATSHYSAVRTRTVKLLPLPHSPARARTDARTNPSAQRATQLRSVIARVYAISIQKQITTTVL
jgi:hypothetical protein